MIEALTEDLENAHIDVVIKIIKEEIRRVTKHYKLLTKNIENETVAFKPDNKLRSDILFQYPIIYCVSNNTPIDFYRGVPDEQTIEGEIDFDSITLLITPDEYFNQLKKDIASLNLDHIEIINSGPLQQFYNEKCYDNKWEDNLVAARKQSIFHARTKEEIKAALDQGSNINAYLKNGDNILIIRIKEYLNGFNFNYLIGEARNYKATTDDERIEGILYLIERGADIHWKNLLSHSALMLVKFYSEGKCCYMERGAVGNYHFIFWGLKIEEDKKVVAKELLEKMEQVAFEQHQGDTEDEQEHLQSIRFNPIIPYLGCDIHRESGRNSNKEALTESIMSSSLSVYSEPVDKIKLLEEAYRYMEQTEALYMIPPTYTEKSNLKEEHIRLLQKFYDQIMTDPPDFGYINELEKTSALRK